MNMRIKCVKHVYEGEKQDVQDQDEYLCRRGYSRTAAAIRMGTSFQRIKSNIRSDMVSKGQE